MRVDNVVDTLSLASTVDDGDRESLKRLMSGLDYDQIYIDAWKSTISRCEKGLERNDLKEALKVMSVPLFRQALEELLQEYRQDTSEADVLLLLLPVLEHYNQFSISFVSLMREKVDVSMMWGLLYLVVKLSLHSEAALDRVSRMVKSIGIKLEYMNETMHGMKNMEQKKNVYVEISKELINLWLNIITAFRDCGVGKSQIALMYAHHHADHFDAIFWIHAQTLASLEQSVMQAVRLVGLNSPNQDAQGRIVFLDWLQRTGKLFRYWTRSYIQHANLP
ncbi:hypothetical protein B0J18DRAFT_406496 [Chaetomium sp. MPI-SDFR-AT-0129]|nr:hypothetical protein B0J18DRAFT_406496 [Chaetomium sp. MPI-SDFR-AT-0129]